MQKLRHLDGLGHYSLFFAVVAFTLGAHFAVNLQTPIVILLVIGTLPLLFSSARRGKGNVLVFLSCLALGFGLFSIHLPVHEEKGSYTGFVIKAKANYFLFLDEGRRYYVYEKENTRQFGDFLTIEGRITLYESTEYESRFSFKDYLKSEGVSHQLIPYKIEPKFQMPWRLRQKEVTFLSHFSSEGSELIDALLFDHKDYSSPLIQKASGLGCLYFLSLSGVLYSGALRGIEKLVFLRFNEEKTHLITWVFALLLLPFGLYKVGIWRVFLMRSYALYAERKKTRSPPKVFVISFVALITLIVSPYSVFNTGFLLGYGLSLSLSFSHYLLAVYPGKKRNIATAIYVLIFLFPTLASSSALHIFSGLYSLCLMPIIYPFAALSFLSFCSLPFVSLLNAYAHGIGQIISGLAVVDVQLPLGQWGEGFALLYYLLFFAFYCLRDIGEEPGEKMVFALFLSLILFETVPLANAFSSQVSFINVGQGDAILIREGYHSVMIDTGGNLSFDMAQEVDIPFLRKNRIYHLDYVIASHGDYDHIGAASSLSKHFRVDHFVTSKESFPLRVGSLNFVNYNIFSGSEENEESLVLGLDFMGKKWLFTGDAPIRIEKKIIAQYPSIDCDILKVGHHGSDTSSCAEFLKALTPEVAIISVGKKNHYGHPSESVIDRLNSYAIPIRRTDVEGTITYETYFSRSLGRLSS
jgi:beta-lactamase superfamily II metal-dependent hydrolase